MSTQTHHSGELVPRPEATPEALRQALAAVAPDRLAEMQQMKDTALSEAVDSSSTDPLRTWILFWRTEIEIARRPDLTQRIADAKKTIDAYDKHLIDDEESVSAALKELSEAYDEAVEAVRA